MINCVAIKAAEIKKILKLCYTVNIRGVRFMAYAFYFASQK